MSTKVTFKSGRISVKIKNKINKIAVQKKFSEQMGKVLVKQIKADTLNGKDFKGKSLKGIKQPWISDRDKLKVRKSADYGKGRSNLTLTGRLVKSIGYKVKTAFSVIIDSFGNHPPYTKGRAVANTTIIAGQKEQGRDILGVSKESEKQIVTLIKRALRRSLR